VAIVHIFPAQARSAGSFISASVTYSGGFVDCSFRLVDANWLTEPTSLIVTIFGEESFDGGTTWLNAVGPYSFSPPAVGKNGILPGAGFQAQNDGGGLRLVRATLTLNQSWTGGVDGSIA
jgi:hypothetical protein